MKNSLVTFLSTITAFILFSCSNEILPSPTLTGTSNSSRCVKPTGLVASNGLKQKITLSWNAVKDSDKYNIYSSSSPYSEYNQIAEIKSGSTSIDIQAQAGSDSYYKITAVNASNVESEISDVVRGTTLAQPIITLIEPDESNSDSVVQIYWYMSNCTDETYKENIQYHVACKKNGTIVSEATVIGSELSDTKYTFSNLEPNSSYTYLVESSLLTKQSDIETSDEVDADTARRLIPNPPEEISAAQGSSINDITISFVLPDKVDVLNSDYISYSQYPIYFKIYRKPDSSESEDDWVLLDDYFGIEEEDGDEHPFISDTDVASSTKSYTAGTQISEYIPKTKVIWTDKSAEKNIKYIYKVQSYDDFTNTSIKKIVTSILSCTTSEGWKMSSCSFSVKDYTPVISSTGSKSFVSASCGLNFSWNNFGKEELYNFKITSTYKKFLCDDENQTETTTLIEKTFETIDSVNEYVESFDFSTNASSVRGYYSYTIYIIKAGSSASFKADETTTFYNSTKTSNFTVTDNASSIENFTVTGGYSSKYLISWTYDSTCTYSLKYTETLDGATSEEKTVDVSTATVSNGTASYTDSENVVSGSIRTYTLYAEYISSTSAPFSSTAEPSETLGTPSLQFDKDSPCYDSITVYWKKVQDASSYSLQYSSNDKIEFTPSDSNTITDENNNVFYYCTFDSSTITDFNNAGSTEKTKKISVFASSEVDTTQSSVDSYILNPCCCSLTSSVAKNYDKITLTWNKIEGASGYILQRTRYNIPENGSKEESLSDEQFYISSELIITQNGENYSSSRMTVSLSSGIITLEDKYCAADDATSKSQLSQEKITWGVPFEYVVIPVKSSSDSYNNETCTVSSKSIAQDSFAYENISSVTKRGSAIGYGQNVEAGKADSASYVEVTWCAPYIGNASVKPVVYKRITGSSDSWAIADNTLTSSAAVSSECLCNTENERTQSYEYAVKYISNSSDSTVFTSSYIDDLKSHAVKTKSGKDEIRNTGYLFHLKGLSASNQSGYSKTDESFTEVVSWQNWDYANKPCGPEDISSNGSTVPSYTIWEKNYNNAAGWYKIATMTVDGTIALLPNKESWYEIDMTSSINSMTLTPTNTSGTNNGLLKVQRDYKHYYMISAQRVNSKDDVINTYLGSDDSIWTYRKISNEEFCKNITLILADATNQSGVESGSTRTCSGNKGEFSITQTKNTTMSVTSKRLTYGTHGVDYQHVYKDLPGKRGSSLSSGYTINIADDTTRASAGYDDNKVYYFHDVEISVAHETGLSSYEGTVYFTAGTQGRLASLWEATDGVTKEFDLTVKCKHSSGSTATVLSVDNNETLFKEGFPFNLAEDRSTQYSSYNSSLASYNNDWWAIRENSQTELN